MASMLDKVVGRIDLKVMRKWRALTETPNEQVVQDIRRAIRAIEQRGVEVLKDKNNLDTKICELERPTSEDKLEVRIEGVRPRERSGTPSP